MTEEILLGRIMAALAALALLLPCATPLRVPAAALNVFGLSYGVALGLWAVILPHAMLLPLSLACLGWRRRLWLRRRRDAAPPLDILTPQASAARRFPPTRNTPPGSPRR